MLEYDPYIELVDGLLECLEGCQTIEDVRELQDEMTWAIHYRQTLIAADQLAYLKQSGCAGGVH